MGYAITAVLARASSSYHILLASRTLSKGDAARAAILADNKGSIRGQVSTLQLDVTSEASVTAAAKHVESQFGRLDVLINNAGIVSKAPSLKTQFEETFTANVTGPALVSEAFKSLLLNSSNPYSLYISSGLGSLGMASDPQERHYHYDGVAYRMSKSALNMIAVQDAKVLGKQGVKVFAVCPGLVVSNLRGTEEEQRTAGGAAGDPEVSGQTVLGILEGQREEHVGRFVHKDGVYPW